MTAIVMPTHSELIFSTIVGLLLLYIGKDKSKHPQIKIRCILP